MTDADKPQHPLVGIPLSVSLSVVVEPDGNLLWVASAPDENGLPIVAVAHRRDKALDRLGRVVKDRLDRK